MLFRDVKEKTQMLTCGGRFMPAFYYIITKKSTITIAWQKKFIIETISQITQSCQLTAPDELEK